MSMKKKVMTISLAASIAVMATTATAWAEETNILDVKLGEDYTDLKADLKFVTHRTDLVDTVFADYVKEFQEMYPNITISYEGITNYADDIMTRMSTGDWGDIAMIPTSIDKDELPAFFEPFGNV